MLGVGTLFWVIVWFQTKPSVQFARHLSKEAKEKLTEPEPLERDLVEEEANAKQAMTRKDTIAASHVDHTFDRENLILDDVSVAVNPGDLCVLLVHFQTT